MLASLVSDLLIPFEPDDPFASRERRARAALVNLIDGLRAAHAAHHDPEWTLPELAGAVRRAIEGVHLRTRRAGRSRERASRRRSGRALWRLRRHGRRRVDRERLAGGGGSQHLLPAGPVEGAGMAFRERPAGGRGSALSRPAGFAVAFRRAVDHFARRRSDRGAIGDARRGRPRAPHGHRRGARRRRSRLRRRCAAGGTAGPRARRRGPAPMGRASREPPFSRSCGVPRRDGSAAQRPRLVGQRRSKPISSARSSSSHAMC